MTKTKNIFTLQNLTCAYPIKDKPPKVALKIKHIDIPRQKITMLLGKSGAGKSTILETLGLMNNTLTEDSLLEFHPTVNPSGEPLNFVELWQKKEVKDLAEARNEYFSFIFQSTNLMPNFTAYENICLTQMIQGTSQAEALQKVEKIMDKVGLGEVEQHKKAYELSGGQQQRVAFVRAITPKFTVLFGDEPTGNLDEGTADTLMEILVDKVKNEQKTAIIVTHDIELALNYADQIIIITKEKGDEYGQILPQNIFNSIRTSNNDKHNKQADWLEGKKQITRATLGQKIRQLIL